MAAAVMGTVGAAARHADHCLLAALAVGTGAIAYYAHKRKDVRIGLGQRR